MKEILIHGTCIDLNQKAVLICGKPGFGKSSLALQLIDRGATLIADDQTILTLEKEEVIATAPLVLKGLMEVREIGICSLPYQDNSSLKLCVDLCEENQLERLPKCNFAKHHGIKIPLLKLKKNDPLGAIKVELKLSSVGLKPF